MPLDEELLQAESGGIEVMALDRALEALAAIDGRKSRLVELRYFGGLSVDEAARILGVSKETAKRDWKMARAWLYAELAGGIGRQAAGPRITCARSHIAGSAMGRPGA